jgi:hypothetical protein
MLSAFSWTARIAVSAISSVISIIDTLPRDAYAPNGTSSDGKRCTGTQGKRPTSDRIIESSLHVCQQLGPYDAAPDDAICSPNIRAKMRHGQR